MSEPVQVYNACQFVILLFELLDFRIYVFSNQSYNCRSSWQVTIR